MRRPVDAERIRRLMRELGHEAETDVRLYFTGGATAVLFGWRMSTIDVDVKLEPDTDRLLRALPRIKDTLQINIELASPDQFIPELPGWHERSTFIAREGRLSFYHYDFYAQALAKIERGHAQDRLDVREMVLTGPNLSLVENDLDVLLAVENGRERRIAMWSGKWFTSLGLRYFIPAL